MNRIRIAFTAALLISITARASMAAEVEREKILPSPTPVLSSNTLQASPPPPSKTELTQIDSVKSNGTEDKGQLESGSVADLAPPPPPRGAPPTKGEDHKKDGGLDGKENITGTGSIGNLKEEAGCDGVAEKCHVADLVACLQLSGNESKELILLVQNGGEDALTVNIKTLIHLDTNSIQVAKHSAEKIRLTTNATEATDVMKIVLNAGKEDCVLSTPSFISDQNPSQKFHLTLIHGVYFLIVSMVLAGGTWACCKFRKKQRRGDSGIPYQQLEMGGQLRSSPPVAHEGATMDSWEESWDDAWDEEEAVGRPLEKHSTGSVSSSRLTSRPPNRDGWDVDWDD